jgi:hypothetical protein
VVDHATDNRHGEAHTAADRRVIPDDQPKATISG